MLEFRPGPIYNSIEAVFPSTIVAVALYFWHPGVAWYWLLAMYVVGVFVLSLVVNIIFKPSFAIKPAGTLVIHETDDKINFSFELNIPVENLMQLEGCTWRIKNELENR